ncbi:abnormal spindle-like microcephaly-associated protein homolog [Physella acuta]|uniref:abnormal spindle-like microcephaly-associated protein homolog n=1 Tax=Physella acuta TaxID=109671 RepID=UPI0027DB9EEF|nr:abnormal spindle-like microcephaly-associated protein homolog [Physella acuta]XP_059158068.1 abnormal spindle-like microcephaly-associated protein homolog [Physella acuta]
MATQTEPHGKARYSGTEQNDNLNQSGDQSDPGEAKYLHDLTRGRAANFYINGDVFFPAKRVVYNPKHFKDMSHYLDYLTDRIEPKFGAVRKIHTPRHGHRVNDLQDIQENAAYVVAGTERFKPYSYDQITASDKKKSSPFKYDVDPVYHNRQYLNSGKIHKMETQSTLIKVWPNGSDLRGPRRVLLTPRVRPFTLENVMLQVNEMLKEDCSGTVEKLYMLNGIKVSDIDQIVPNGQYVACRKTERFKRARYNEQGTKNLATSPRLERKYLAPIYPHSNNSTIHSTPESSKPTSQNSLNSNPQRRRPTQKEEDKVFPAKPVKYTRSNERGNNVDYDKQDDDGVFKAKQAHRETKGAKEVPDTRHTKTDLPVDFLEAEEVEDETIEDKKPKKDPQKKKGNPDENSKRSPPPVNHQKKQEEFKSPSKAQTSESQKHGKPSESKPAKKIKSTLLTEFDEEDEAAAKIQAGFRGYQTRKELGLLQTKTPKAKENKEEKAKKNEVPEKVKDKKEDPKNAKAQEKTKDKKEEPKNSKAPEREKKKKEEPNNSKEHAAAAKIQAGFRGYQTRKELASQKNKGKDSTPKTKEKKEEKSKKNENPEKVKNKKEEPNNSKEHEAAAKIQAGFRGYQTRKLLAEGKKKAAKVESQEKPGKVAKVESQDKPVKDKKGASKKDPEQERWEEEEWAATKIQSAYRGYATRKELGNKKPKDHQKSSSRDEDEQAALKIQAAFRGHQQRKSYNNTVGFQKQNNKKLGKNEAAAKIQASYRSHLYHREMGNRTEKIEHKAASKIQAAYRGHQARKDINKENIDKNHKLAASRIQAAYRGHRYRKEIDNTNDEHYHRDHIVAATKIQSSYRGHQTRKEMTAKHNQDEIKAATKIQASYKGYQTRKNLNAKDSDEHAKAAAKIQASYKGYQTRKNLNAKDSDERAKAAAKIQASYKGYQTRKNLNAKDSDERAKAAAKIQASYKGYQTRKNLNAKDSDERAKAAAKIQASYKGYQTRKYINENKDAAKTIQAAYRGHQYRRDINNKVSS